MNDTLIKLEQLRNDCSSTQNNNEQLASKAPALNYVHAATSLNTRRAYQSDAEDFRKSVALNKANREYGI